MEALMEIHYAKQVLRDAVVNFLAFFDVVAWQENNVYNKVKDQKTYTVSFIRKHSRPLLDITFHMEIVND